VRAADVVLRLVADAQAYGQIVLRLPVVLRIQAHIGLACADAKMVEGGLAERIGNSALVRRDGGARHWRQVGRCTGTANRQCAVAGLVGYRWVRAWVQQV